MYPPAAGLVGVVSLALSKHLLNELQSVQQEQKQKPRYKATASSISAIVEDSLVIETKDEIESFSKKLNDAFDNRVDFTLEPFFENYDGDEDEERFFEVKLDGIQLKDLSFGPFELAHHLKDDLQLISCDTYFADDEEEEAEEDIGDVGAVAPRALTMKLFSSSGGQQQLPDDFEWHLKNTKVPEAWEYSKQEGRPVAGEGIIIAQIDTGSAQHRVVPLNGDVWHQDGQNFVNPRETKSPIDPFDYWGNPGHGHRMAAVAAGDGTVAGKIIRGSAPNAKILPMRCIKKVMVFHNDFVRIAKAIDKAVHLGASVITMSLGNLEGFAPNVVKKAIKNARDRNVILIAAAGQISPDLGIQLKVIYPARDSNVMAVGGSTEDDKPWKSSFVGERIVVSAPATNIVVPNRETPTNQGTLESIAASKGTSFATALSGGIAAMWLAHHGRQTLIETCLDKNGSMRLQDIFEACCETTATPGKGKWDKYRNGAGVINAEAILKTDLNELRPRGPFRRIRLYLSDRARDLFSARSAADDLISVDANSDYVGKITTKELKQLGEAFSAEKKKMSPRLRQILRVDQ